MQTRSAPRTASRAEGAASTFRPSDRSARCAKARTCSGRRLHARTRRSGRACDIASRWVSACTPVPSSARSPASARASNRVATPETAAVRTAVIELASITASRLPRFVSKSSTAPWCESSSVPWFPGKTVMDFTPMAGGEPR